MATTRLSIKNVGDMVATMFGIPMNWREATAYQAIAAGIGTPEDAEVVRGWCVKAALANDFGVAEDIAAWVRHHLGDVSPT